MGCDDVIDVMWLMWWCDVVSCDAALEGLCCWLGAKTGSGKPSKLVFPGAAICKCSRTGTWCMSVTHLLLRRFQSVSLEDLVHHQLLWVGHRRNCSKGLCLCKNSSFGAREGMGAKTSPEGKLGAGSSNGHRASLPLPPQGIPAHLTRTFHLLKKCYILNNP